MRQNRRAKPALKARPERRPGAGAADSAFLSARRAMDAGNPALAAEFYRGCIAKNPRHAEAHHDLGVIAAQRGEVPDAIALFKQAVALRPHYADAHANICLALRNAGRPEEALAAGQRAVALAPGNAQAHAVLGSTLDARGDIQGAAQAYTKAVGLDPKFAAAHVKLAEALRRLGRPEQALPYAERGVALAPHLAEARSVRGLVREAAGHTDGALDDFRQALALCPSTAAAHIDLSCIFIAHRRFDQAADLLRTALALDPDSAEAYGNLGVAFQNQGRLRDAFEAYRNAIRINPRYARAQSNLGGLLIEMDQLEAAATACHMAIAAEPDCVEAFVHLAVALRRQGKAEAAIAAYRQALAHRPDLGEALVEICHLRQHACDWAGLKAEQAAALALSYRSGKRVPPFPVLTSTASRAEHQLCARAWAAGLRQAGPPLATYAPRAPAARGCRLRIGYLSADFHNHATAMLTVEMFEQHDRARFETFGYSYGPDDGSDLRRRIVGAFDHCVDLRQASHLAAARHIRADEIDILVDLKGYTRDARPEILAHRPAPIQVNYLGFPGTMGADFIDYIVADAIVAPMAHERFFDEKIVHLPHCYQPNDRRRALAAPPSRAECGLPEQGFVFCSFNNSYKITPEIFEIWMRLLRGTPGAVLWLLEGNDRVAANLRRAAGSLGVAPHRLVFAGKTTAQHHMARMAVADLFLDTLPINAHTTASEALWAGLPVLTCTGEAFAGRVATSLLAAVGLPELISTSLRDYEALAFDLADDIDRMRAVRQTLAANRLTSPLFNSLRSTRGFEAALTRMAELRDAGQPPAAFAIDAA